MIEKYMDALEQYEMEILSVRKGRGSWLCETEKGSRILKEYRGTVKRLEFEEQVLKALAPKTSLRVDRYVRNKEDSLVTATGDGCRYILKEWFEGRECNIRDVGEIRQVISRLALLHRQLRDIEFQPEWDMGSTCVQPPGQELARHSREMLRARNYIRGKRQKSDFELSVIGTYDMFYEQAKEAEGEMCRLWPEEGNSGLSGVAGSGKISGEPEFNPLMAAAELKKPSSGYYLCHGDLDHHHVFVGNGYTAIVEYNRMHLGVQASDLYRFMRKVMEKHNWNLELGISMLDAYERVLPMERKERASLYCLFLYPEKYWKQLNFYYNANKAWIPAKNTEKLKNLKLQQTARNGFLRRLKADCGL